VGIGGLTGFLGVFVMVDKSNDMQRLYGAVGFVVVHWALLEQSLDTCITILYHYCDGKTLVTSELPFNLTKKRKFLKLAFNNIPKLEAFKDDGLLMVKKVGEMSGKRDDLVHSAITKLEPVNGVFHFQHLKPHYDIHHLRQVKLDMKTFPVFEKSLESLQTTVVDFAVRLATAFLLPK